MSSPDVYTHGHHESVLRSHTWRTAENSARYLIPELRPGMDLLDVGCGPGTITLDLAQLVGPGTVIGLDREAGVLVGAERARSERNVSNASFTTGDVYALDFPEASFDVVHAHQVLQHLTDPVAAITEMRRLLRPGGLLAVRDGDYGSMMWDPQDELLDQWLSLYHQVTKRNGAEADAGRFLSGWVRKAGFEDLTVTTGNWTYADPRSCRWWGELWADRVELSSLATQAVAYGLADRKELSQIAAAWRRWSVDPGAFFNVVHVEVLARR
ncbi:MAG: methyltransferase domain-containing protein [Acidimicrobiales bacterium]